MISTRKPESLFLPRAYNLWCDLGPRASRTGLRTGNIHPVLWVSLGLTPTSCVTLRMTSKDASECHPETKKPQRRCEPCRALASHLSGSRKLFRPQTLTKKVEELYEGSGSNSKV